MAGGIGSRFWPMSSPEMPKQFIDVLGCGRTLIQLTVDRFKDVCLPENVWVVTSAKYAEIVKEQLPEVPVDHILLEPCRRNTAPCIAYVSWKIKARNPKANIVVTPSDHVVMNVREFGRVVTSAMKFTADSDAIVTLGMKANRPETGYGYIEADLSMACPSNKEIYRVDAFRENLIWLRQNAICSAAIISGMQESLYGMSIPLSMPSGYINLPWQGCSNACSLIIIQTRNRRWWMNSSRHVKIFQWTML